MNPAILAAALWLRATGLEPPIDPAAALREERRAAHRAGDPRRELDLVDRELAALAGDSPDRLAAACDAAQAGFRVCGERLPELGCAGEYLQRYADAGCLADPLQLPRHHFMWALHWQRQMDFAAALAALRRVVEAAQPLLLARLFRRDAQGAAELLDLTRDLAAAAALRTELAAHLRNRVAWDRSFAALSLFLDVLAREGDAYAAAVLRNQIAWGLLVLREAGLAGADPVPLLTSALATFTADGTRDRSQADNVRINLALAALQRGALDEVERVLAGLGDAAMSPEERMWLHIIRLRAALARGRVDEAIEWQAALAGADLGEVVPMGEWFVAWTRGLVDEARGDRDAAIAAYEAAEAVLEAHAHARNVAAYGAAADGRYRMFAATTRRLLDLRLGDGDDGAALSLARNARNRALRMHAREWCQEAERPRDDLPGPGALHLLYFPLDPAGADDLAPWVGFAVTATGVRAEALQVAPLSGDMHRLSEETLSTFSEQLLAPFEADIAAAEVVTIFPTDALHALPFHALPWDGGILLDAAPVQYGLDVAACGEPAPGNGGALVISGSDYSLPEEGRAVTAALAAGGVRVDHRAADSPEPFAPLLTGGAALAHLAAHGQHPADEAVFAADVQLAFGGAHVLTRETILAAPAVPQVVYLSACRSSFVDADTLGGGLSLAHAFLLRGARQVVGSVRDVDADATRTFALEFYAALAGLPPGDVAEAWRAAYLSARATVEPSLQDDLRMLRLFVP